MKGSFRYGSIGAASISRVLQSFKKRLTRCFDNQSMSHRNLSAHTILQGAVSTLNYSDQRPPSLTNHDIPLWLGLEMTWRLIRADLPKQTRRLSPENITTSQTSSCIGLFTLYDAVSPCSLPRGTPKTRRREDAYGRP
jgi:hypothetical protein